MPKNKKYNTDMHSSNKKINTFGFEGGFETEYETDFERELEKKITSNNTPKTNALEINGLSFGYTDSDQNIVQNFSLNLENSQKIVLLGSNGVGKSSLLNAIWLGSFGHVLTPNQTGNIKLSSKKAYFRQDIPQNLDIDPQNIRESIYEILYHIEINSPDLKDQTVNNINSSKSNNNETFEDRLLDWFSLVAAELPLDFDRRLQAHLFDFQLSPGSLSTDWKQLSPGTQKKILLSILMATEPDIVLADELTNHLDFQAIEVVKNWMQTSKSSFLLIDHNSEFLSLFNNFLFLPNNKSRKTLYYPNQSFDQVMNELDRLEKSQIEEQQIILRRKKALEKQLEHLQFRAEVFNADIGSAARSIRKKMEWEVDSNPILDEMDINKQVSFGKIKAQKIKKNMLIDVKNLEYKIGQSRLQKISEFKLWEGDRVRIVGPNGRGKSTLIKLIRGVLETEKDLKSLQEEYQKEVEWMQNLDQKDRQNYFSRYQNYAMDQYACGSIEFKNLEYKQFFVFEQVSSYPAGYTLNQYLTEKTQLMPYQIPNFLKKLKLEKFSENTHLNKFSLGEYIRLQFGILGLLSDQIKLLILDEPGNFLDIFTQKALVEMLASYTGSLILITHDQALAQKLDVDDIFEI